MTPNDPDFVTIAEAARLVGVDPRQVRRWMPRLSATDKATDMQRTHKGQPIVLVRMSAVKAIQEERYTGSFESVSETPTPKDKATDRTRDTQETPRQSARMSFDVSDLLAEKDARIAELTRALDIERDAHKRAELLHLNTQGELQALRKRALELEAARGSSDSPEGFDNTKNEDTPRGVEHITENTTTERQEIGRDKDGDYSAKNKSIRPWWAFWGR